MKLLTSAPVGRKPRPRLVRVRVLLCSNKCRLCVGEHRYTEPLDAERIDANRVRITSDPLWHGAVVSKSDFKFCEDEA